MVLLKLGILISGRGSNMHALINACMQDDFPAEVSCVISNNPNANGLLIAQKNNIKTFVVQGRPLDFDAIDGILKEHKVDLVCLAGFMSIVPEKFINKWLHKVINIHPSLLPSFKGLNAQAQALKAGVKIAGCTVHYVYPEVDGGPIIIQAAVPVFSSDTVADLSSRILQMEYICYPKAVKLIALNQVQLDENIATSKESLQLFYSEAI
ncbi:phosphoribosylglycinamide formyltransferase [Ehrlichia minasensis]|uniref:Phosphoribosylglycinamide formyltransferase n=1 Tax=Ehrlichia minasensis TaxID=1242993 RepID=A0A4Q6IAK1_9RICK|nr:phosphoribosylglycinamide formyltransferase [Ehrlichia minasensis]RZB12328.1 phosphoribosylglycinamide formyltransferase [Ehrlichia minasensis]CEI85227.1 Formyltetrahydrofolate-dependent phosphoribosylgl ycinamide formyltransferase [Ehrlichia minasensis]